MVLKERMVRVSSRGARIGTALELTLLSNHFCISPAETSTGKRKRQKRVSSAQRSKGEEELTSVPLTPATHGEHGVEGRESSSGVLGGDDIEGGGEVEDVVVEGEVTAERRKSARVSSVLTQSARADALRRRRALRRDEVDASILDRLPAGETLLLGDLLELLSRDLVGPVSLGGLLDLPGSACDTLVRPLRGDRSQGSAPLGSDTGVTENSGDSHVESCARQTCQLLKKSAWAADSSKHAALLTVFVGWGGEGGDKGGVEGRGINGPEKTVKAPSSNLETHVVPRGSCPLLPSTGGTPGQQTRLENLYEKQSRPPGPPDKGTLGPRHLGWHCKIGFRGCRCCPARSTLKELHKAEKVLQRSALRLDPAAQVANSDARSSPQTARRLRAPSSFREMGPMQRERMLCLCRCSFGWPHEPALTI